MNNQLSDDAILKELGRRLQQYRLNRNMTQEALARDAGISARTINRIEHGHSTQLSNLIRLLRSLDLLQNADALVPELPPSPIQQLKLRGKSRERASPSEKPGNEKWSWGENE